MPQIPARPNTNSAELTPGAKSKATGAVVGVIFDLSAAST
jgi:hypothetical protein